MRSKAISGGFDPLRDVGVPKYVRFRALPRFPVQFKSIDSAGLFALKILIGKGLFSVRFTSCAEKTAIYFHIIMRNGI